MFELLNYYSILFIFQIELVAQLKKILEGCNEKVLNKIKKEIRRVIISSPKKAVGIMLLQLLFDSEIRFDQKLNWLLPLLQPLQNDYPNIRKLILEYGETVDNYVLKSLLSRFPNLTEIEGCFICTKEDLFEIQTSCDKLEKIRLIPELSKVDDDKLSKTFFNYKSLDKVEEAYMKCSPVTISFPYLKVLSLFIIGNEYYRFCRMLLHFYPSLEYIDVISTKDMSLDSPVSWFDTVISDTIILNPDHSLKHADITIYDILLPYTLKTFKVWKNLETVTLHLGYYSNKKFPMNKLIQCGNRVVKLFDVANVNELCLRFLKPMNESEIKYVLFPVLQKHGSKFHRLRIWEKDHTVTHKILVQILNYCPNLQRLLLVGKPTSKYCKDLKLISFPNLEILCTGWMSPHYTSRSQVAANFLCDLLCNSPNIRKLQIAADEIVLETITAAKFGANIEELSVDYYKKQNTTDKTLFTSLMKKLPNLVDFKIDDQMMRKQANDLQKSCSRRGISVSEFNFDDDIVTSCGSYSVVMTCGYSQS